MFRNAKYFGFVVAAALVTAFAQGCDKTCTQTSDCGFDAFCSNEGICESECEDSGDCSFNETCSFGRCYRFAPPRIVSITPEGGVIGSSTRLDIEISFLGAFADVTLERSVGTTCVPFVTRRQSVANAGQDSVVLVSFEDVPALGRNFEYLLSVESELGVSTRTLSFQSNESLLRSGLPIEENVEFPPEQSFVVDNKASISLNLSLEEGSAVWAETFAEEGSGGGGRVVGEGTLVENAWVPLVPNAKLLSLEFQREGRPSTGCEIALESDDVLDSLDISLTYLSSDEDDPADLDLVLVLEEDGQRSECTADAPTAECRVLAQNQGTRTHSDEVISLVPEPRVVGIYVRSAHVSASAFAILNIVDRGLPLATSAQILSPAQGDVWLVGRVFVQGDSVFERLHTEPQDEIVRQAPTGLPSTW